MGQVRIGHAEAECVQIEVLGREPDDWLATRIKVVCGIWRGEFRSQFYKGELGNFGEQIQRLHRELSGFASLEPMEPNLTLKMIGDGKGHITVEGRAAPEAYAGTYLTFRLLLDQTELPAIASALIAADPG
jgi:hypothetical protein